MTQFGGGGFDPVDPGDTGNGNGGTAMATTFVQQGAAIDYTPGADTPAGTVVVQGDLVGVTRVDLKAGQLGALAVEGVFDFPKATTAGTGFTAGQLAYWDNTNDVATKTATGNKLIGKVVRAAADAEATVRIRLSQ
jgi:predicted RecA/RadA family phage recombinase